MRCFQDAVLGALLFIMYTSFLSSLLSSCFSISRLLLVRQVRLTSHSQSVKFMAHSTALWMFLDITDTKCWQFVSLRRTACRVYGCEIWSPKTLGFKWLAVARNNAFRKNFNTMLAWKHQVSAIFIIACLTQITLNNALPNENFEKRVNANRERNERKLL